MSAATYEGAETGLLSAWDTCVKQLAEFTRENAPTKAKVRGAWPGPSWLAVEVRRIYWLSRRDGMACRYCTRVLTVLSATVDHLTPKSRGGSNRPSNLGLACRRCNSAKGAMTEAEYLAVLS